MLVADVDRHQRDRTGAAAQHRLDGHRQGAGFRFQQTPGAGTAAFHEVFHRVTAGEQLAEVFAEHRRVKLVALEGAADEERAQATEDRAGRPEVEVDARGDVRRHQALVIQHVGQQQIVHVAAVAGHVDDLVAVLRQLAHALGVGDVDALIQPVPGPAQHAIGQTHGFVGEVGGDLFHQRDGILLGLLVRDLLAARFVLDRFFDRFGRQQLVEQILTGRQAWAYCGQALTREVHARHARQFLRDGFIRAVFGSHAAQRNGVGEAHEAVAAEPQHGEEFLHAVQQTQVRRAVAFAARRAAEHDRNR
ncbi:Uncharacterised protein [Acinetobacter baumannii]|nr:Uncharacterised protein [Acinetobacter baumannii]